MQAMAWHLRQALALCVLLGVILLVAHAQSADEQQSSDKLVRAASERQIQEAVDGHSGDDTLTILLSGSVRLTRSINLRKGTGPVRFAASKAPSKSAEGVPQPAAALDGTRIKPAAPVLVVSNAAALTISGLSFTGPKGAPAIYARQSGPISVTDSIFKNNNNTGAYVDPPHGGAIACLGCQQLSIEGSSFDSNAATIGGAIFAVNLAKGIQVKGSWMLANQGGSEGGSVAIANSVAEFSNCTFRKSETVLKTGWGGGISTHNSSVTIDGVLFDSGAAGESGGAFHSSSSNVTITNSTCVDTASQWFAGCFFFISRTNATVTDTEFRNNNAATAGGGIHTDRTASVVVTNCHFENNTSPYGGAINGQEEGGSTTVRSSRFYANSASDKGAAIHVESRTNKLDVADSVFDSNVGGGVGGAVACTTTRCLFSNVTFTNNTADQLGGALWTSSASGTEVNNSRIVGNKALRGGGLCVEAPDYISVYDTSIEGNTAGVDGGGVLMVSVTNGTGVFVRSPVKNNTAAIGGGFTLISANNIVLEDSTVSDNSANIDLNTPLVSTVEGSFSSAGSGGGIFGTQCGVRLVNSRLQGNVAAANGGGAALQLCNTTFEDSVVRDNQAVSGNGGGVSASVAGDMQLIARSTTFTNNSAVSGGAAFVSGPTNAVAVGHFSCDKCKLDQNWAQGKAVSIDRGGGGLMATGNVEVIMSGSTATSNTATSGPGGALHCLQCNSLSLTDCKLNNNAASGPGGGACCDRCDHVSVRSTAAESNVATAGAGLFLSLSPSAGGTTANEGRGALGVFDSRFHNNTAGAAPASGSVAQDGSETAEGDASTAAGSSQGAGEGQAADVNGAGGAAVINSPVPFEVSGSRFTSNNAAAGHGGAIYHQACTSSTDCKLSIKSSSFDGNSADKGGGGAVFTTNGTLLSLPDDCKATSSSDGTDGTASRFSRRSDGSSDTPCRDSSSFQSSRNKAAFGADVASNPARLGVASGSELAWLRQLDDTEGLSTARRRLMAAPPAESASSSSGAPPKVLYLESNNRFNLEVQQLDHWGSSIVTDGTKPSEATIRLIDHGKPTASAKAAALANNNKTGSLCAQSCEAGKACIVGCLTGATTVAFKNGVANFSSVGLSAPANSSLKMQVMPGGLSGVPLVDVLVRVHTCGVGEYQSAQGSCEQCPAPQINLDPYQSSNCSSCPTGANCQAGFPTPLPGFWHSHHRSTLFHRCPSTAACTPGDGGKRMLAYQQLHKHDGIAGWLENETAVGEEYLQAQCAPGRAGPLCSSCARGFGMGPGNVCRRCPSGGRAGAIVAYILVRLVDVLLVTLVTCLMLLVWSRARAGFSGSGLQSHDSYGSSNSATGLTTALTVPSDPSAAADGGGAAVHDPKGEGEMLTGASQLAVWLLALLDWHQLAYLIFSAAAPLTARGASMLLALLLTTPQSTLHWVPMDCMVGAGMAGKATPISSIISSVYPALLTLATFGVLCLLKPLSRALGCGQCCSAPRRKQTAAAAAATDDSVGHAATTPAAAPTAAAPAAVKSGADLTPISPFISREHSEAAVAGTAAAANGHSTSAKTPSAEPVTCRGFVQDGCQALRQLCTHLSDASKHLGMPGLLITAAVASLCYCSVDLAATAVGAFQCTTLDPVDGDMLLPGERRASQGRWWSSNLNLPCYGSAQVAAAAAAGAVCLPLLLLTLLLVAAVIKAARYKQNTAASQQLYDSWISQLWGRRRAVDRGSGLRWVGWRWAEALAAPGVTFVAPMKPVAPMVGWGLAAVLFRILLAVLLTAIDNVLGSSVLLRAMVASGALACMQLLLAWVQPGVRRRYNNTFSGCYMLLQVLCVLTVAAEVLQPVGPASRAVLYTLLVVVGSANCLYMAFRAARSCFACLL